MSASTGAGYGPQRWIHDVRVRPLSGAAHTAAQLVELGQAETLRVADDDRVGVRYVESRLDDRGAEEHVDVTRGERAHHRCELGLRHLSVRHLDACLGYEPAQPFRLGFDGGDAVVP